MDSLGEFLDDFDQIARYSHARLSILRYFLNLTLVPKRPALMPT
jgi:hypothetical protein